MIGCLIARFRRPRDPIERWFARQGPGYPNDWGVRTRPLSRAEREAAERLERALAAGLDSPVQNPR